MTLSRMLAAALQRLVDRIDPQEGRYRMLFESSPLPMWVFDAETLRFLAANETAIRLYSHSRQEFLSMPVEDICRAEDCEAFRQFLRRESGSVNRGVFRHVKRGGEPIDIEGVGYLVSWRGRAARLVLINDITERLRTSRRPAFASRRKRSTTWCGTPARAICGCACSPAARGSSSRCAMTAAASMSRRRGGARRRARASGSPVWKSASRWRAAPSSCARRPDKAPYCWHHSRSSRERNHKPPDVVVAHPCRTRR